MCPTADTQTNNNTNNTSIMVPTSDCRGLTSTWKAVVSYASFNLYCNYNAPYSDLLNIWVYTFEDCIRACSSYDLTTTHNGSYCYGISYAYTLVENQAVVGNNGGNCWLKAEKYDEGQLISVVGVDSAFLIHDSLDDR